MAGIASPNLDLNTLRLFADIFRTGSLAQAAVRSQITPAGVSRALARMRLIFNDELFTRHSSGMVPTPKANEIYPRVLELIGELTALTAPGVFEHSSGPQVFRIASYEANVLSMVWPAFPDENGTVRENVGFDLRPLRENFWADLQSGFLDFVVAPVTGCRPGFHTAPGLTATSCWSHSKASGTRPLTRMSTRFSLRPRRGRRTKTHWPSSTRASRHSTSSETSSSPPRWQRSASESTARLIRATTRRAPPVCAARSRSRTLCAANTACR